MADDIFDEVLNSEEPTYYNPAAQVPVSSTRGNRVGGTAYNYGPTKVTQYGAVDPPGSPDYDSNSWNGIGDRNNQLGPGSAALSVPERQVRFPGYNPQHSTGLPFEINGQTYYDHDTSPQKFRNIDVFVPRSGQAGGFQKWGGNAPSGPQIQPWDESKGNPFAEKETFVPPPYDPPAWSEIQSSDSYQQLNPEQRGELADKWYADVFNAAGALGNFTDSAKKELNDFHKQIREQATFVPPLDLGKTASDTASQVYGTVQHDIHTRNVSGYKQEGAQEKPLPTDEFTQAAETIRNSPDLTDDQKAQGLKALQDQWEQKQVQVGQQATHEQAAADKTEKDYGLNDQFSKTPIGQWATQTGHFITQALPMVAGVVAGGPALGALGGAVSMGASGYEEHKANAEELLKKENPKIDQATLEAKATQMAEMAEKGDMTAGAIFGGMPADMLPLKGFAAKAGVSSQIAGMTMAYQKWQENKAMGRPEDEGVLDAWKQGTTFGALAHSATEVAGGLMGKWAESKAKTTVDPSEWTQKSATTGRPIEAPRSTRAVPEQPTAAPPPAAQKDFVPSSEWQHVPTGTAVPLGGEYRMNMATGTTEARWDNPPEGNWAAETKQPMAAAAYRDSKTGEVATGVNHNDALEKLLPDEKFHAIEATGKNPYEGFEPGYVDKEGKFHTKEEAEGTPSASAETPKNDLIYTGPKSSEPGDLRQAAAEASQHIEDPQLRQLAEHVAGLVPEDARWDRANFQDPVYDQNGKPIEVGTTSGIYHPETKMALISDETTNLPMAILHEAGHAALADAITDTDNPGVQLMLAAYEQAKLNAPKNPPVWLRYGLSSPHEFVSAVLSDENMQRWLQKATPQGRATASPFGSFVKGAMNALGMEGKGRPMQQAIQGLMQIQHPGQSGMPPGTVFASSPFFNLKTSNTGGLGTNMKYFLGTFRSWLNNFHSTRQLGPMIDSYENLSDKYIGPRNQVVVDAQRATKGWEKQFEQEIAALNRDPNAVVRPETRQVRNAALRHINDDYQAMIKGGFTVQMPDGRRVQANPGLYQVGMLGDLRQDVKDLIAGPAKDQNGNYAPQFNAIFNEGRNKGFWKKPEELEELLIRQDSGYNSSPVKSNLEFVGKKWPTPFYETGIDSIARQLRDNADARARLESIGQSYYGHPDEIEKAKQRVENDLRLDQDTRRKLSDSLDILSTNVYHKPYKWSQTGAVLRAVATATQAATPQVSMKIAIYRMFYDAAHWGPGGFMKAAAQFMANPRDALDKARIMGVNKNFTHYMNEYFDPATPTISASRAATRVMMEASGHGLANRWPTAINMLHLSQVAADAIERYKKNTYNVWDRDLFDKVRRTNNVDFAKFMAGDPEQIANFVRQRVNDTETSFRIMDNPVLARTAEGRLMMQYTHWSYNATRMMSNEYIQPMIQAFQKGDGALAGLYLGKMAMAAALGFGAYEAADQMKSILYGKDSDLQTWGQFMMRLGQGNYGKALEILSRHIGEALINDGFVGILGGWTKGVTEQMPWDQPTDPHRQPQMWNPFNPPVLGLLNPILGAYNKFRYQGMTWNMHDTDRLLGQIFGAYREARQLGQSAEIGIRKLTGTALPGEPLAQGLRDRNFSYSRQNQFYTDHPNLRPNYGNYSPTAKTPYYETLTDALYAGDAKAAQSALQELRKSGQDVSRSGLRQAIEIRSPMPYGKDQRQAFTDWAVTRKNLTPEEWQRIQSINQVYHNTASQIVPPPQEKVSKNPMSSLRATLNPRGTPPRPVPQKYRNLSE